MDVVSAAMLLRQQTNVLKKCEIVVATLERELSRLEEEVLLTAIENDQSRHLHLLQRVSVIEGVYNMYKQYHARMLIQKQSITDSIKSQLESHQDNTITMVTTTTTLSSTFRGTHDRAAEQWSTIYCALSRQQ